MSYTDLTQIQEKINTHKADLAANLVEKSVDADSGETFAVLIGKVKDIEQSGGGSGGGINWSAVTDMQYAFYNTKPQLLEVLMSSINTDMSQVVCMYNTFYGAIISDEANEIYQRYKFKIPVLSQYAFRDCKYLSDVSFAENIIIDQVRTGGNAAGMFYGCNRLPLSRAITLLYKYKGSNALTLNQIFYNVGKDVDEAGSVTIDDIECPITVLTDAFYGCVGLGKIGNLVLSTGNNNTKHSLSKAFKDCVNLSEVGTITASSLSTGSYNIFDGCTSLKKIGGFLVPYQALQGDFVNGSTDRFLGTTEFALLEECLNMPIEWFRHGGTNIANLYGTSTKAKPLRRLTFCKQRGVYNSKNYPKNLPIQYCSFDRDGMLEVFNTIPDASDITYTSTITITGNPCVIDGTLTEEDIAIATSKGYVVTTA